MRCEAKEAERGGEWRGAFQRVVLGTRNGRARSAAVRAFIMADIPTSTPARVLIGGSAIG